MYITHLNTVITGEDTVFNLGGSEFDANEEIPPASGLRRQISETASGEGNIFSSDE